MARVRGEKRIQVC